MTHEESYSLLPITLLCKLLLYKLLAESIVSYALSKCFLCFLFFYLLNSYVTLLLFVNPHAAPVDDGFTTEPNPITDNVTEVDVVVLITILPNDFNIVVNIFVFCLCFFLIFCSHL